MPFATPTIADFDSAPLDARGPLPLVLRPRRNARPEAAAATLRAQRDAVEAALLAHGALLFRGIDVRTPEDVEAVALAVASPLANDYLGTSPRNARTTYVHNASELPPFYPIPQHCEMSFVKKPPSRLLFSCLVAPHADGETPLADFRAVLRDLAPDVRARFERLGVRNVRNYTGPEGGGGLGPWQLKPWHELFGTTDRARVEAICRENDFELTWLPGGRLRLVNTQSATRLHPTTGEPVWFNHTQVFHASQAYGEFSRIARRQRSLRIAGLALVARTLMHAQKLVRSEDELAMNCTYGDGSPIPDADVEAVRDAIWKNLRAFRWERGDVVLIDNFAVSHGRMPYRGPREVVVAWS
jgi:alpha-ketoglutarate-dependent taurine dioxygenase